MENGESLKWSGDEASRFMFIVVEGQVQLKGSVYFSGYFASKVKWL